MSMTTWTQYVSMDDPFLEPGRVEAELENLEGWDDDFDLGEPWDGGDPLSEED